MNTYSGAFLREAAAFAQGLLEWQSLRRRGGDAARCGNTALAGPLFQHSLVIAQDHEMQQAAFRHSRETHAALLSHLSEHGSHPALLNALRAGCMPFPLVRSHTLH